MIIKKIFNVVKFILIFTLTIQILSNCTSVAKKETPITKEKTTSKKQGLITALTKAFSPNNDGILDKQTFKFNVKAASSNPVASWVIDVKDLTGMVVYDKQGSNKPPKDIIWDGRSNDGQIIVNSAIEYPMKLSSVDNAGNKSAIDLPPVSIGILVNKIDENGKFQISINNIQFKPDTAVMTVDPMNIKILNMLADGIKKFPDHKIIVEGYANKWKKGLSKDVAYELSVDRAKVIVSELVNRGVRADNLLVRGKGFEDPIIPLKIDMTIAEKEKMKINRRVEFYKQKQN